MAGFLLALGVVLSGAGASSAQPSVKSPVIGLLDAGQRMEWWAAFHPSPPVSSRASVGPAAASPGLTSISNDLDAKRLELLREVMPKLSRLALLWHADNTVSGRRVRDIEPVAQSMKLDLRRFGIRSADELPSAFAAMVQERAGALFVVAGPQLFVDRERLAALALKHRLPSMHTQSEYVDAGGLIAYGPSYPDLFRRAAVYVDKILKGAKPGAADRAADPRFAPRQPQDRTSARRHPAAVGPATARSA